eukprot:CAMPEP_0177212588 /NCGR_PEP_ID=MMETSP0367-20130122/32716_1 /TAXON_ID=447022 ORGANISM="Scrippsiella hangoei-like, Strain SHHI-4" /NCGR_SAMPLE_ID=MMETSP0367 /ASSEMBLY_ACC=CAM_ASM_000362 /LENGTH=147 /DNA_ID=CAMNT_0018661871 /DNA_START=33 /DNA_END=472 /DNA_ORIENTATION=-
MVAMSKLGGSAAGLLAAAAATSAFVAPPAAAPRSAVTASSAAATLRGASASASASASAVPGAGLESFLPLGVAGLGAAAMVGRQAKKSSRTNAPTAVKAFEGELGVQPPTGFWDPAGYCSDGDAKEFYRRRRVELKHGRVAMLATIG